mmetsp:Transcript_13804/g.27244  ORF Transcript_13804/g.27244 Transcript_13804/m.27244 type:complete len:201 (-) Transcript_13804:39-641(-)
MSCATLCRSHQCYCTMHNLHNSNIGSLHHHAIQACPGISHCSFVYCRHHKHSRPSVRCDHPSCIDQANPNQTSNLHPASHVLCTKPPPNSCSSCHYPRRPSPGAGPGNFPVPRACNNPSPCPHNSSPQRCTTHQIRHCRDCSMMKCSYPSLRSTAFYMCNYTMLCVAQMGTQSLGPPQPRSSLLWTLASALWTWPWTPLY